MTIEQDFDKVMMETYKTTVNETKGKYNPHVFHDLLLNHRGVKTARMLVLQDVPTEGFERLYFLGRLDLTVEYLMLQHEFQPLFTTQELITARERLAEYKFPIETLLIVNSSDTITPQTSEPKVAFDKLTAGQSYDRPQLAEIWGYDDWHGFGRGVFTPRNDNKIVLFVTHKNQESLTRYSNFLDVKAGILHSDGERGHQRDERIINTLSSSDEVYVFYRDADHEPFIYYGQAYLFDYVREIEDGKPSQFRFSLSKDQSKVLSSVVTEIHTHGDTDGDFFPDAEGNKKIRQHIAYERSVKNRTMALKIHGKVCKACGFDFNEYYGKDLANDYIEVHHVISITKIGNQSINPATDLVPLCSNCHSMVHRQRGQIMPINELKLLIKQNRIV